ncbi:MAG: hypothetical protein EA359_10535 [Balneolaceae bacterium]|nr:MAG: hypothetical protein EA359_10535 [Balneolaceae bacterium]
MRKVFSRFIHSLPGISNLAIQLKFKNEIQLIKGLHNTSCEKSSIIHFSINKSATQYVKKILTSCSVENGLTPIHLHGYAFQSHFPYLDQISKDEMKKYSHLFKPNGYLYSVFGGMIDGIEELHKYKIILMIRDPRDILVSKYFSVAYSRSTEYENEEKNQYFMERRSQVKKMTLDEFVLSESDSLLSVFSRYERVLVSKYSNMYLSKYEEMVSEFPLWLSQILEFCELEISKNLFNKLIKENVKLIPDNENIERHIRRAKPGDYNEKLKRETIDILNQSFESVLQTYNYI